MVTESGVAYSCGLNCDGRLAQEEVEGSGVIREFKIIKYFGENGIKVSDVATGYRHCIARTAGELTETAAGKTMKENIYAWGMNYLHQLGQGVDNNEDSNVPIKITKNLPGRQNVIQVSAGAQSAAFIAHEDKYM